jgi:hypothetical protein
LGQCTNEEKFLFPEQFREEAGQGTGGLLTPPNRETKDKEAQAIAPRLAAQRQLKFICLGLQTALKMVSSIWKDGMKVNPERKLRVHTH